jgi:hypothetical protein
VCRCGVEMLLRATPQVLSMRPCTVKWDEEKSKHAGLAQENGFAHAQVLTLLRLVKGEANLLEKSVINMIWLLLVPGFHWPNVLKSECNEYDLTAPPCFWLAKHNDWSRWSSISSSYLFAVLVSVLWVGLRKSK